MEETFVEVFFCNSDKELNAATKLLEKESIDHVVNQTNDISHKYSISVPENKVDEVLKLLEKEIKDSPDENVQNANNSNKESDRRIIAIIAIALLTIILFSVYKVSVKIYSNIKYRNFNTHNSEKKVISPIDQESVKDKIIEETSANTETEHKISVDTNNKLTENSTEKGGVTLYGDCSFYDIPADFGIDTYSERSFEDDYIPPEEPISEIILSTDWDILAIHIPVDVYNSNPEIYLEADHDGETFIYNNKKKIFYDGDAIENQDVLIVEYYTYISFTNKNLFSNDNSYIIRLRNCKTDEMIVEKTINRAPDDCNYVVYRNDYKSPFYGSEHKAIKTDERMHFMYKGEPSKGDMLVISYCYYSLDGISYVPFAAIKSESDKDGVCSFDFKIHEPGQYKIDFYNEQTGEIRRTSSFDYLLVRADKDFKATEQKGTNWQVNSPEGLRLRSYPWGEKIGLLKNGEKIIQTNDTVYPFYDFINEEYGFWIPVRVLSSDYEIAEEIKILKNNVETNGWVFSGFLRKIEE